MLHDNFTMFEIRGAGNGLGQGMFATLEIPKGTRILAETPMLLILDGEKPFTRFRTAVSLLSAGDQAQIQDLSINHALMDRSMRGNIRDLVLPEIDNGSYEGIETLGPDLSLYAKFITNRFEVVKNGKRVGMALCPTLGRLNHSCVPNVYHAWNTKLGQATLHALCDIKEGEQLCITYLPNEGADMSHEQRQIFLQQSWKFTCGCEACAGSNEHEMDKTRLRIKQMQEDLKYLSDKMQQSDISRSRLRKDARKATSKIKTLIDDLDRVGLAGSILIAA